jgi:spermidine synthase
MFWKTLAGICIYKSPTAQVFDNYFFRWLTFGNDTIQTLIYKSHPEKFGLSYITMLTLVAQTYPGSCCLLGLGGGGALQVLKDQNITVVELNNEVLKLAKQYFYLDKLMNVDIIHQDAEIFVHKYKGNFRHILIDLFSTEHFPTNCFKQEFFLNCKNLLEGNGFLSVNIANSNERKPIFNWISHLFESTLVIPIKGCSNMIVIAGKKFDISELMEKLNSLKLGNFFWNSEWGVILSA